MAIRIVSGDRRESAGQTCSSSMLFEAQRNSYLIRSTAEIDSNDKVYVGNSQHRFVINTVTDVSVFTIGGAMIRKNQND